MTALTWEWIDSAFAHEDRDEDGKPVGIWIFSRIVDHGPSRALAAHGQSRRP